MELHKIWVEQCDAAKNIDKHFGAQNALRYLVNEKFIDFLEAAESDEAFRAEVPGFAETIKSLFTDSDLTTCLDSARTGPAVTPGDVERQARIAADKVDEARASDQQLVQQARTWLLET